MPAQSNTAYRFADVAIDTGRRRVIRGGEEIALGRLTYDLLVLLVEASPCVVAHGDLASRLWGGRYVARNTLKQRVKLLRDALGDDADNPRYIGIVRGHGYRLIPEVEISRADARARSLLRPSVAAAVISTAAVAAVAAVLGSGLMAPRSTIRSEFAAQTPAARQALAVLPFENLSADPRDAYFADGIQNDLLTQLAKIDDLRVISRTSVEGYRDSPKTLVDIAAELGVTAMIEGSVQRSGDQVRISVQLIDALTDDHIWAEVYDRAPTAEDIFLVQSEMAASIARALHAELSTDDLERLRRIPTTSTRAYNFYLLGEDEYRSPNNMTAHAKAAEAYERAVAEDPDFALAWAALGRAYSAMYYFVDPSADRGQRARAAIDRAFSLDPDLPEAYFARGFYRYHVVSDLEAALRDWQSAEQGMPGDPRIHMARAYVYRLSGRLDEACIDMRRAIELDPRNLEYLAVLADTLNLLRDYRQADQYAERVIAIDPNNPLGYRLKANTALRRDGDAVAARAALDSPPFELAAPELRWTIALYLRDYETALEVLDAWPIEVLDDRWTYRPKSWYLGVTHGLAGREDIAARHFRAARASSEAALARNPGDLRIMIALADILARQGHRERAADLAIRAIKLVPASLPAPQQPGAHWNAILALVAAEAHDAALAELERYLSNSTPWSATGLVPHPLLDPIRDDVRFERLVERHQ